MATSRTSSRRSQGPRGPRPATPAAVGARSATPEPPKQPARSVVGAQADASAQPGDAFAALLERASQQVLAVTFWFDPVARPEPYPVTIRFSGRRVGAPAGKAQPGDLFVHEETITEVVPGSGPVALTARVRGINPGQWEVKASVLEPDRPKRGRQSVQEPERVHPLGNSLGALARLWHRWAPSVDEASSLATVPEPFIRVPGLIPLIWGSLATLGLALALVVQSVVLGHFHLASGSVVLATLVAMAAGIVGAKVWYIVKHRSEHVYIGWCIQGFIAGATATAIVMFLLVRAPLGTVLDASAPGLMLALAVGRVGCFFAGCCGGPPTSARWGVWCSDQHVGARRVPTQLMEALFCLLAGGVTLLAVWTRGPAGGAYFVAVVAAYTLFREGILRLRVERLVTRLPVALTPAVSALALVGAIVVLVR